jgi:putative transposase
LDQTARIGLVSQDSEDLTVAKQCELCQVSRASFYRKKAAETNASHGESQENLDIMMILDKMHLEHPAWGYRMMTDYLRNNLGYVVNPKRTRRLMRLMDIMALFPGPNLSKRYHAEYVRPYLLRNSVIDHPDQVWGVDITYLPFRKGFLYLFVIVDWFTREVVDYEISYSLEEKFVLRCLSRAFRKRKPEIVNSDQGSQFTSRGYLELLESQGIQVSMDGKGQALDNARTERFFRSLKYEDTYLNEYVNPREMMIATKKYIREYNTIRPHSAIGGLTPHAFHEHYIQNTAA